MTLFGGHKKEAKTILNPIPETFPASEGGEAERVRNYLQEWQVIIQTQMHFNDLILRFRSITLTAFVTLVGAIIAIGKTIQIAGLDVVLIGGLPVTLWVTAFILDFGYYHRLLLGSVAEAHKFDNNKSFQKLGHFGLTTTISNSVHPPTSRTLVVIYYVVPLVLAGTLMFWKFASGVPDSAGYTITEYSNLVDQTYVLASPTIFLGVVSCDTMDVTSLMNRHGQYGSPLSTKSIFDVGGPFGGTRGKFSPFNPDCQSPPRLMKDTVFVAYLTENPSLKPRVSAYGLIGYLFLQTGRHN